MAPMLASIPPVLPVEVLVKLLSCLGGVESADDAPAGGKGAELNWSDALW